MEALILAIIIAYAVKKAAQDAHLHWQGAKASNRRSTKGQPVRQRAASAARHDLRYWAHQVRGGFPQVRHGLFMGWHSGRIAHLQGREERAQARAEHTELRARVAEAVREHRRRQAEAIERIRAAAQPEPGPEAGEPGEPEEPSTTEEGNDMPESQAEETYAFTGRTPQQDAIWHGQPGGNSMSGDTTYTQQMSELEAIRRDAEEEVNSVRRKRMMNRLDVLMSLGLDKDTLSEAAEIDDALREQEKAAQQTLDAADAAINGLQKRHGGIKGAVDDSPVDKPAEPEFYQD